MDDDKEVTQVRETRVPDNQETIPRDPIVDQPTVSGPVLGRRIVFYIGGVLIALLSVRFFLLLFGASQDNAFVSIVYSLTEVFVAPFEGIFGEPTRGVSVFDTSTLVAIIVYGLLTIGIAKLFTLNRRKPNANV